MADENPQFPTTSQDDESTVQMSPQASLTAESVLQDTGNEADFYQEEDEEEYNSMEEEEKQLNAGMYEDLGF